MSLDVRTKFYLISSVSILCIAILTFSGSETVNSLENAANEKRIVQSAALWHAKSDAAHDSIRANTESIFFNSTADHKDIIKSNIEKLSGNIDDYNTALQALINLELPNEIHKTFLDIKGAADDFINKSGVVINNLASPANNSNYLAFEDSFTKLDILTDDMSKSLSKTLDQLNQEAQSNTKIAINKFYTTAALAIIFSIIVPFFTTRNILTPQAKITSVMYQILAGNNDLEIPFINRQDEIGEMAKALDKFRINNIASKEFEYKSKQQEKQAAEDKHNELINFSNNFEKSVKSITDIVAAAATEMDATARELDQIASLSQQETKQLSTVSAQTSNNVQSVSKATNEFTVAINEINKQVTNSREYAGKATIQADNISNVIADLSTKANAISGIIDIINNITSQIDLLALNATIEAARAGESGKGFAVVANEVKALATQTSKATEQINVQISAMQQSTGKAVDVIKEITDSVKTINQNSTSIASAVEEQNVTASYIADNVSKVANMSSTVNNSVEKVASAANNSSNSACQMVVAAEDLLKQTSVLQSEVNKFLTSLRIS